LGPFFLKLLLQTFFEAAIFVVVNLTTLLGVVGFLTVFTITTDYCAKNWAGRRVPPAIRSSIRVCRTDKRVLDQ
jgi:hypothetical protein